MPEFEKAGYKGNWTIGRRLDGSWGVVIIAKRRFDVDLASADCKPALEQPSVTVVSEFEKEDDPTSPIKRPSELAIEKRRVDIMVLGTAHPPGNKPTPEFQVSVRIAGVLEVKLNVIGNRVAQWVEPEWLTEKEKLAGERQTYQNPRFSAPLDVAKLPLSYRYAYGGDALLAVESEVAEQAAEIQEEAAIVEKRNERKKELEEELKAEEAEKEAQVAKKEAAKEAGHGIADEETAEKFTEAFGEMDGAMRDPTADRMVLGGPGTKEDGAEVIDESDLDKLVTEDRNKVPELEKVSKYAFGDEEPEAAADAEPAGEPAESEGADDADGKATDDADEHFSSGTAIIDISKLESKDELKELLEDREVKAARKVKDGGKVLRNRATEFGDIELTDDEWIDEHGERPTEDTGPVEEDDRPKMGYPYNPSGRGYCVSPLKDAVDGLKLPNLEWPDNPLLPDRVVCPLTEEFDLYALTTPAGLGPYPLGWFPRAGFAGCYPWDLGDAEKAKADALAALDPDDPEDQQAIAAIGELEMPVMQWQFFQEAHPRLQVERVNGNEEVLLTHLTPDGNLFFRLPGTHPDVTWNIGKGPERVFTKLDQLLIDVEDPDKPAVEMIWRGFHPITGPEALEEASILHVDIDEVDQDKWFDLLRDKEREEERDDAMGKSEGTQVIKAMTDDDLDADEFITGEEAWRRYREEVVARKRVGAEAEMKGVTLTADESGQYKDDAGTAVFDQDQDRRLADDWDVEIREQNEDWVERNKVDLEKAEALKLKAIRKKAREQADEEFGIERIEVDEDGNPIDPEVDLGDGPTKKSKKKKGGKKKK